MGTSLANKRLGLATENSKRLKDLFICLQQQNATKL
jgi:hypothetical protein